MPLYPSRDIMSGLIIIKKNGFEPEVTSGYIKKTNHLENFPLVSLSVVV